MNILKLNIKTENMAWEKAKVNNVKLLFFIYSFGFWVLKKWQATYCFTRFSIFSWRTTDSSCALQRIIFVLCNHFKHCLQKKLLICIFLQSIQKGFLNLFRSKKNVALKIQWQTCDNILWINVHLPLFSLSMFIKWIDDHGEMDLTI